MSLGPGTTAGLLALQLLWAAAAPAPPSASDAEALLELKASFDNGDQVLTTWVAGTDACAWLGVSCSPSRTVVTLDLVGLGLVGSAPQPDGWPLPASLRELYFGELPEVTGPIPPGWRLPNTLTVLYTLGLPLGGTISPEWVLPDSLQFLNMGRCNLSGSLPEDWLLPANLTGLAMAQNRLAGTVPSSLTTLPMLQTLDLSSNQLTGSIPANMSFGQYDLTGLNVANNNLSGRVPSWPDEPRAQLAIQPGNPFLCGQVPTAPVVIGWSKDNQQVKPVTELPPCPGDVNTTSGNGTSGGSTSGSETSGGGSSSSAGAIVGGVVGGVVVVAAVLAGAVWALRRRRHRTQRTGSSALEKHGSGLLDPKLVLPVHTINTTGPAALQPRQQPFNPFAGGPKRSQSGSSAASQLGTGSSSTLPISAAAILLAADAGSGASSGKPEDSVHVAAKLEALQRQPPAWFIDPDCIVLEQGPDGRLVLLGRGSYGHVYRGGLKASGGTGPHTPPPASAQPDGSTGDSSAGALHEMAAKAAAAPEMAAKALITPAALKVMDSGDVNAFLKEASMMQRLADCPEVVALYGACVVGKQLVVAMELIEGGDLRAALSGDRGPELSWRRHGRQVALDIAAGLAHLHTSNVMHRDLKSKNVLLTRDWRAKVADVGTAALHSATFLSAGSSMFGGTLAWAAPELLLAAPCTSKIDIYSLGVVLWELATREVPRRGFVQPPPPSDDCPQGLCELIADCLQQDPALRPTAQQALDRLQAL